MGDNLSDDTFGFSLADVRNFIQSEGNQVENSVLVSKFKKCLKDSNPDNRDLKLKKFKNIVNEVAYVRKSASTGDKVLVLRKKYWVCGNISSTDIGGGDDDVSEDVSGISSDVSGMVGDEESESDILSSVLAVSSKVKSASQSEVSVTATNQSGNNCDEDASMQSNNSDDPSNDVICPPLDDVGIRMDSDFRIESLSPETTASPTETISSPPSEMIAQGNPQMILKADSMAISECEVDEVVVVADSMPALQTAQCDEIQDTDNVVRRHGGASVREKAKVLNEKSVEESSPPSRLAGTGNRRHRQHMRNSQVGGEALAAAAAENKVGDGGEMDDIETYVPLTSQEKSYHLASARGDYETISEILSAKPDLARRGFNLVNGYTAAHWAAKRGDLNVLELVLGKYGCPTDVRASGSTPLHLAARSGHGKCVDLLVKKYLGDVNVRDYNGKKAGYYWMTGPGRQQMDFPDVCHLLNVSLGGVDLQLDNSDGGCSDAEDDIMMGGGGGGWFIRKGSFSLKMGKRLSQQRSSMMKKSGSAENMSSGGDGLMPPPKGVPPQIRKQKKSKGSRGSVMSEIRKSWQSDSDSDGSQTHSHYR